MTAHNHRGKCRRCGIPVIEWGGMCHDCLDVVRMLGESDRWKSDYSKADRRRMMRRLAEWTVLVWWEPPHWTPHRIPQRPVRLVAYHDEPDWRAAARQVAPALPPPGSHLIHPEPLT